jgi:hypothetical protein
MEVKCFLPINMHTTMLHTHTHVYTKTIFTNAFFITKPTSLVHLTNLGFLQLPSKARILLGQYSNNKKMMLVLIIYLLY